jgi:hypothetical protein
LLSKKEKDYKMKRTICDDTNNGKLINKNFNEWYNIKDEVAQQKWEDKTTSLLFGTHKNDTIIGIIDNFNPKRGYILDCYLKEVERAFKKEARKRIDAKEGK